MEDTLPEGWARTTLGNVVDYGQTRKAEPHEIPSDAWVLELEDIERDTSKVVQRATFAERASKSTKNRFFAGDVLYGKLRPYLNKVVLADADGYCTTEIIPLNLGRNLDPRFVFYWLKHPEFLHYVSTVSHGMNMPRLGTDAGRAAPFTLAPLPEQQRIADKLDTLLARVAAGRERLERIPKLIKQFRRAVLSAAMSGELTRDWRGGEDATWERITVGDLLASKPRNGYSPQAVDFETPVRSLTLAATTTGQFDGKKFKFIDEVISPDSHLWLKNGDILIQRANSLEHVGVSAVYTGEDNAFIYPDLMMKARAASGTLTNFVHYTLLSQEVRDYFRENATGTAGNMPKINQQTVISAPAAMPPLPEQAEIVRRVEALFAVADRLETRYRTALTSFDRLTPALLAKAFRGELVPQDPNDEPASVLLERIQAQRASSPGKARPGRSVTASKDLTDQGEAPPARRRGRPRKSEAAHAQSAGTEDIPQANSFDDAVRLLEERKLAGTR